MGVGIKNMEGYVKQRLQNKYPKEDPEELEGRFWDYFNQYWADDSGSEVADSFLTWMQGHLPLEYQIKYIEPDVEEFEEYLDEDEG